MASELPPGFEVLEGDQLGATLEAGELPPGFEVLEEEEPTIGESVTSAAGGMIIGATKLAGAPIDLSNFVMQLAGEGVGLAADLAGAEENPAAPFVPREPLGGSVNIQRSLAKLGLAPRVGEDLPDPFTARVAEEVGAAGATLVPFVAAARAGLGTRGLMAPIFETFRRGPKKFVAGEVALGTTSGIGAATAQEMFPGSPTAELIGQLTGGFVGVPTLALKLPVVAAIRRSVKPFTPSGARAEASRRLRDVVQAPGGVARDIRRQGRVNPLGRPRTPAQLSGDPGLLSLERAVIRSSAELGGQYARIVDDQMAALRAQVASAGEDVPINRTTEFIEGRRQFVVDLLNARTMVAVGIAQDRVDALRIPGGPARRTELNTIAREEIEGALVDARSQETEIWGAIDRDLATTTEPLQVAMQAIIAEQRKAARPANVPADLKRLILPKRNKKGEVPKGAFGDVEPVDEILALRSRILDDIRVEQARDAPNRRLVANLQQLQAAALDSLGALERQVSAPVGEDVRFALDFSRTLNDRFTRGPVGRLLGFERAGGAAVDPALTLERTVGRSGPAGDVETRAILDSLDPILTDVDPATLQRAATRTAATRGAVEEFMTLEFFKQATDANGRVLPPAADRFLRRNAQIFERFPGLRDSLRNAEAAQSAADGAARSETARKVSLYDKRRSRAALFIDGPPDKAIARVTRAKNPAAAMGEIVRQARKDPTGDALRGLKTAFVEQFIGRAELVGINEAGGQAAAITTLRQFRQGFKDFGAVIHRSGLLTGREARQLRRLVGEAGKIEKSLTSGTTIDEISASAPNAMVDMLSRVVGANLGARLGSTSGATLVAASAGSKMVRKFTDKIPVANVRKVIAEAVFNPELMATLLERVTEAGARRSTALLRAHLVNITSPLQAERDAREEDTAALPAITPPARPFGFPDEARARLAADGAELREMLRSISPTAPVPVSELPSPTFGFQARIEAEGLGLAGNPNTPVRSSGLGLAGAN